MVKILPDLDLRLRPEVKTAWLDALRSGDYTQGQGFLGVEHEDGSAAYCCLGVLCDLAARQGVLKSFRDEDGGYCGADDMPQDAAALIVYAGRRPSATMPPVEIMAWAYEQRSQDVAGRDWDVTFVPEGATEPTVIALATLNDDLGFTFAQIADRIEADL